MFESVHVGDLAVLAPAFTGTVDTWKFNGEEVKLLVKDIFNVTVGDVIAWTKSEDVVTDVVETVFGERDLED